MPAVVLLAILLQTATPPAGTGGGVAPPPSSATQAKAVRAAVPVVIDGRDDDAVWRIAQPITRFREFQPKEDGDPRFATEAKVAYDDRYFYVFIRAFDPHPDSILKLLARRDVRAATDQLKIMVDSYHDRRSGGPPSSRSRFRSCATSPEPRTRSGSRCGGTFSVTPSGSAGRYTGVRRPASRRSWA